MQRTQNNKNQCRSIVLNELHYFILRLIIKLSLIKQYSINGEGNGNPLQYSCLEKPVDRGAWWAAFCPWGHTESDTTEVTQHACMHSIDVLDIFDSIKKNYRGLYLLGVDWNYRAITLELQFYRANTNHAGTTFQERILESCN